MINEVDYILKKESETDYSIAKFVNGEFSCQYSLLRHDKGIECSCICGINRHRNLCKHKDWVRLAEKGKELPSNVSLALEPNRKEMKEFIHSILKDENK